MTLLVVDRTAGIAAGLDRIPPALVALRRRSLDLGEGLVDADWGGASRCELWTAHDVVRHVRDACRVHVGGLRRDAERPLDQPFDNQRTPQQWLERSAGQRPDETLAELRRWGAEEAEALGDRARQPDDEVVSGPYGPIPWTVLTAHVLWDAWLHERDVSQPLRRGVPSSPAEEAVAAGYALFIASMVAVLRGVQFETTVALAGDGGSYLVSVTPGHVELDVDGSAAGDLNGAIPAVVDSLAGRGPMLSEVLDGDPAKREPLTWLRPMLGPRA
jgi:hypothetical protein